jgi:hypothetical protein
MFVVGSILKVTGPKKALFEVGVVVKIGIPPTPSLSRYAVRPLARTEFEATSLKFVWSTAAQLMLGVGVLDVVVVVEDVVVSEVAVVVDVASAVVVDVVVSEVVVVVDVASVVLVEDVASVVVVEDVASVVLVEDVASVVVVEDVAVSDVTVEEDSGVISEVVVSYVVVVDVLMSEVLDVMRVELDEADPTQVPNGD